MFVKPCPKCGRMPKIEECVSFKDVRRRMCSCPNYCSVVSTKTKTEDVDFISTGLNYTFGFVYRGDGDNNAIFRIWNKLLKGI